MTEKKEILSWSIVILVAGISILIFLGVVVLPRFALVCVTTTAEVTEKDKYIHDETGYSIFKYHAVELNRSGTTIPQEKDYNFYLNYFKKNPEKQKVLVCKWK